MKLINVFKQLEISSTSTVDTDEESSKHSTSKTGQRKCSTNFSTIDDCLNKHTLYSTFCTNAAGHSCKKTRTGDKYSPIVYALLQSSLGKEKRTTVKVLLGSGASHMIVSKHCVRKLLRKKVSAAKWHTAAGTFSTKFKSEIKFQLPELVPTVDITTSAYVYEGKMHDYDIIVGRDLLNELGIDLCLSDCVISWPRMHAEIPMNTYYLYIE